METLPLLGAAWHELRLPPRLLAAHEMAGMTSPEILRC
jgi:hypothetical protein